MIPGTQRINLGNCADYQEGYVNPPQGNARFFDGPIKWLRAVDLNDGFVSDTSRTLTQEGFRHAGKSALLFEPGTLAISKSGTIGRLGILRDYMCGNRAVINIRPRLEICDPLFLFFALKLAKDQIISRAEGSVQKNLYVSALSSVEIDLPPLSAQREIAAILGALDDKIELNRKTAATLEAMARALYRSWFVDFDPVHAKSEGRPPAHMDPTTAALFPDSFGEDGLPVGWKSGVLADVASITMGQSPRGDTYNSEGVGMPLCNGPVEFGDYFVQQVKWTTEPTKLCKRGDLIVCVRGSTTGRHAFSDVTYCLGRGVCSISGKADNQEFATQAVLSDLDRLLEKTTGSVFPNLSGSDISTFEITLPPREVLAAFSNIAQPLRRRVEGLNNENQTLATLRDTLLPRLMSGDLRVGEVREHVEAVA